MKEYYQKNKDRIKRRMNRYRKEHPEIKKNWRKNNPDKIKAMKKRDYEKHKEKRLDTVRKYNRTKNGIYTKVKSHAKYKGRKSVILWDNPFPDNMKVCFHDINNVLIIPMPRITHQHFCKEPEKHMQYNEKWINEIYSIDMNNLFSENFHGMG